ncbi:MptD family putative ECF transporter S component [Olsenella uli]|uniref:MptD family putative ECF transporter S component n=1 Tax=Olsenella uli TaxID=133926 RepID=UPI00241C96E4|nr:MptD family putative ECF transporter S component [Olsenella uli]
MAEQPQTQAQAAGKKRGGKLNTKDLIYAGAFCALYIILMLIVVMGSSMVIPLFYFIAPLTVGTVCGTVYMLYVLKVRKFGAALILGILFILATGSFTWYALLLAAAVSLLTELIIFLGKYASKKMYLLSYVVFNLTMALPYLTFVFNLQESLAVTESYYGAARAQEYAALFGPGFYIFTVLLALAGGVVGTFVASRLVKKHFAKAGIV